MMVTWLFPHFHPVLAGAAERFRRYAPHLNEVGFDIDVITARDPADLVENEVIDGLLPVQRMEVPSDAKLRDLVLYQKGAARISANPGKGLVQTIKSDRRLLPSLWRMRRAGRRLVQVCTMVEPGLESASGIQRWKLYCSTWLSLKPCTAIITSSEVMASWHRQFGIPHKKLHVIPNGVDTSRFRPAASTNEREEARARLRLPQGAFVCLLAGNLIPRKRPHLVVDAWRRLSLQFPDAILLLAGSAIRPTIGSSQEGSEIAAYQERLFAAIDSSEPNVRWLGERNDMEDIYRAADIFAFPTEQEGFGNVMLEAMASGLPVLSSRFRGFPQAEVADIVQVVEEDTTEAWASALALMAANKDLRTRIAITGLSLVEKRFKMERIIDQLSCVYQQSLKR
jgi:glycosyltransferase involved in cell wall biosynthesis